MNATLTNAPPRLQSATGDQEQRFAQAFLGLEEAVQQRAFPGAALAVTYRGALLAHKVIGRFTYDTASPAIQPDTMYDLASLTKVMATTTAAMVLYQRGQLDLETPLVQVLPEFENGNDARRKQVSLKMLLGHCSGLPAYVPLYKSAQGGDAMVRAASSVPLEAAPGTRVAYSDVGFLLLGLAIERIAQSPLSRFCQTEIFRPLCASRTCFCPPPEWRNAIPPTEDDTTYRRRIVQGEVHDENAAALGGVAGHAGLFAPVLEVASFAECMLNGGAPILRPQTIELFTQRQSNPAGTCRALGWDTPSSPSQSGNRLSPQSFGHLGFTGISLWIDPRNRLTVTLLTNRTWPDRKSELIKQVRPTLHNAICDALSINR